MLKPRVCYIDAAHSPLVGYSAHVFTVNHYKPQLTGWIWTSKVLSISGAEFETLNTIYYQAETDESAPYTLRRSPLNHLALIVTLMSIGAVSSAQQPLTIAPVDPPAPSIVPGFPTIEAAAIAGLKAIAAHSNSVWYEWGGLIVKTYNGFVPLPPNTQFEGSHVHIEDYSLPPGAVVGSYHNHPCKTEFFSSYFSPSDLMEPIFFHKTVFMGDFCSGLVHEFKPGDKIDVEQVEPDSPWLTKGRIIGTFTSAHAPS